MTHLHPRVVRHGACRLRWRTNHGHQRHRRCIQEQPRNRLVAGLIAAAAVCVVIGAVASSYFAILANRQTERANQIAAAALKEKERADEQQLRAERLLYANQIASARPESAGEQKTVIADTGFRLPPGVVAEKVASAPVVKFPMFACFDDTGRLYVAEGSGKNISGKELEKLLPCKISLLEDTDGDGRFDKRTVFADNLIFPAGVLWHEGKVYTASPPGIWVFEDTDGDGKSDKRELLVGGYAHDGTGHDVHGPFFGPDGWLYWTDGLRDYKVPTKEGTVYEGRAALIWRCRPDGTKIEWLCGGGIDNPVELLFLPGGALIGTMDQTPGDAILHYIDGGWYPSLHDDRVRELPVTGPQLGAVEQFSAAFPAALCGFCRVRSEHFGRELQGALITSQFNVHRLQKHELKPAGATWKAKTSDFVVSTNYDFHPTDVLEDADGSLIMVDMGGWYNYHCPNSKYSRPDLRGGLYRIRRAHYKVRDPWGKQIDFSRATTATLIDLLDDPRPKVRDKTIESLVVRGDKCVAQVTAALSSTAAQTTSAQTRLNAVWVLTRINSVRARAAVRTALADPDETVRHAAAHCVGVERDQAAMQQLSQMVVTDKLPLRLKAAEALGRIGNPDAIMAIQKSLPTGSSDRFLEHTLIYALIQLNHRERTLPLLSDANPDVRRAGLIALDQMKADNVQRSDVTPLLDTEDPSLQQAALDVIARREGWADEIVSLAANWLRTKNLTDSQTRSLTGAIVAFSAEGRIQQLVEQSLSANDTPVANRVLLLRAMARCRLTQFPSGWTKLLKTMLEEDGQTLRAEALNVVRSRSMNGFDAQLKQLASRRDVPADQRVTAIGIVAARLRPLPDDAFALLASHFTDDVDALDRLAAASAMSGARLNDKQFAALTKIIENEGPLTTPLLTAPYRHCRNENIGRTLMQSLQKSPGASALTVDDLESLLKSLPVGVRESAQPLLESRANRQQQDE